MPNLELKRNLKTIPIQWYRLYNLEENLKEQDLRLEELPFIIQYNKRDLPNVLSVEELEEALLQKE